MNRRGLQLVSQLGGMLGLERMVRLSGQPFIAPFYHLASNEQLPHIRHLYAFPGQADFERDLDQLLAHFEPVTLEEYRRRRENGPEYGKPGQVQKPAMLLSFDDGLAECHSFIAPLLKKKGVPALFFLNNHFIDNKGLFFRYKASLLTEHVLSDPGVLSQAAAFLRVSEPQVRPLLMAVSYGQQILLDHLADELKFSFAHYQKKHPVYMTSAQIRELIDWGFEIGAHSRDHPRMDTMEPDEVIRQVISSVMDLQDRFRVRIRGFSFPFSSAGIPGSVIRKLIGEGITLFGISGIRNTPESAFIQRIDMEKFGLPARDTLRIKYMRHLLRKMGGNQTLKF